MSNYANWLKNKLIEQGMTQTDLAKALNINPSIVSNWICGRHHPDTKNQLLIILATKSKKKDFIAMFEALLADHQRQEDV